MQTMVLNHLSGASSPGVAATVLSGVFVTAATLAVFFFEPRQRGFIHTNDLISPKKKSFFPLPTVWYDHLFFLSCIQPRVWQAFLYLYGDQKIKSATICLRQF